MRVSAQIIANYRKLFYSEFGWDTELSDLDITLAINRVGVLGSSAETDSEVICEMREMDLINADLEDSEFPEDFTLPVLVQDYDDAVYGIW